MQSNSKTLNKPVYVKQLKYFAEQFWAKCKTTFTTKKRVILLLLVPQEQSSIYDYVLYKLYAEDYIKEVENRDYSFVDVLSLITNVESQWNSDYSQCLVLFGDYLKMVRIQQDWDTHNYVSPDRYSDYDPLNEEYYICSNNNFIGIFLSKTDSLHQCVTCLNIDISGNFSKTLDIYYSDNGLTFLCSCQYNSDMGTFETYL